MNTIDIMGVTVYGLLLGFLISATSKSQMEKINERFDRIEAAIAAQATTTETGPAKDGREP